MSKTPHTPHLLDPAEPFVMSIADKLSDDPFLIRFLGPNFKVTVDFDAIKRRVTYSFRTMNDAHPDDWDVKPD